MTVITPEERALIDAAIAAGRVRVIPRGQSGNPDLSWTGNRLVFGAGAGLSARPRMQRIGARASALAEAVLRLHGEGLHPVAIAERLGIRSDNARDILRARGIPAHPMPAAELSARNRAAALRRSTDPAVAARRAEVRRLHCIEGLMPREICAVLGISEHVCEDDRKVMRLRASDRGRGIAGRVAA